MTDVVDVARRPRRGRLALAATGVAAAALLVPALGADALPVGTFTGGPSTASVGQTTTLSTTNCVPNIALDNAPADAPAAVRFTVSFNGSPEMPSDPYPVDEQGNFTLTDTVDASTPLGTYVFHAFCGLDLGEDNFFVAYEYDQTVTITIVAPTTTTTAPTTSTTARPPATTPIAPAARAAAATPRFTG